jgi:hypothetical protein
MVFGRAFAQKEDVENDPLRSVKQQYLSMKLTGNQG